MWRKGGGSSNAEADRTRQVTRIIDEVIRSRAAGKSVEDSAIIEQHPELMPELGRRLNMLDDIESAARQVNQASSHPDSGADSETALDESRRFLRDALTGYEILEGVHYGGQGIVYRAYQVSAKRTVAIKVLLDGPLATERQRYRFEREVELVSRLRHPNIVTVYESGLVRGRNYCAMEFVEGLPIDDYVLVEDVPVRELVRLFATICRAVSYAHQHGVIHRDLNPANILVDVDGEPHVLDFGLAKDAWAAGRDDVSIDITVTGQCVGTLPYLSPEQAGAFDGQVDVRTDVYSLGITLFRLLTGVFPYPVQGAPTVVRDHIISTEPMPLRQAMALAGAEARSGAPDVNQDLEAILAKSLAKEKERRYQSAAEFADELDRYLSGDAVHARVTSRLYLWRKIVRKHRTFVATAALFLVVLVGASVAITGLWMRASSQRENARETARVAYSALGSAVTEMEDAIRPLAGGTEVRDRLLQGVARDLDRLRPLAESDTAMEDIVEALREKEGDVAYAQGRKAEAVQHYQASLGISLRGVGEAATGPGAFIRSARMYRKMALAEGDPKTNYPKAIDIGEQAVKRWPDATEARYELCSARTQYGRFLRDLGHYQPAAEQVRYALALAEPMAARPDAEFRWRESLAAAHELNGLIQWNLFDGVSSRASLEAALAIREALSEQRPADTELRHRILLLLQRLGDQNRDAGRLEEAKAVLTKAVESGEYLARVEPKSAVVKSALYQAHERLAYLAIKTKDLEAAQVHSDLAVNLAQELVAAEPACAEWREKLAYSLETRARVRLNRGQTEGAQEDSRAEIALREAFLAAAPDDLEEQSRLALAHDHLAFACQDLHQFEPALENYQRALAIRETLLAKDPDTPQRKLDVIFSKMQLTSWHLDSKGPGDPWIAEDLGRQAEAALQALWEAGKLAGREGVYDEYMSAIRQNQALALKREEQRRIAEEGQGTGTSQPASAPQP